MSPAPNESLRPDGDEHEERSSGQRAAWLQALRDVAPYLDLGWRLAGTAAFPPLIGYAVDVWLGTTPWVLLAGSVAGFAGALLVLRRLQQELDS